MRATGRNSVEGRDAQAARPAEVAAYVASLSSDLSLLARRNGLPILAYLLDMARLEEENTARDQVDAPAPSLTTG